MPHIQPATSADIPALLELLNYAYRGEGSKKGWTSEANLIEGGIRTDEQTLADLIADDKGHIFICEDESGKLLGCVHLKNNDGRLYLGMLSVWPELQGQGIGKLFLKKADSYAKEVGCHTIYMQVISVREELNNWYFRHGYSPTGESKPFDVDPIYGVPIKPLVFIMLEKKLGINGE